MPPKTQQQTHDDAVQRDNNRTARTMVTEAININPRHTGGKELNTTENQLRDNVTSTRSYYSQRRYSADARTTERIEKLANMERRDLYTEPRHEPSKTESTPINNTLRTQHQVIDLEADEPDHRRLAPRRANTMMQETIMPTGDNNLLRAQERFDYQMEHDKKKLHETKGNENTPNNTIDDNKTITTLPDKNGLVQRIVTSIENIRQPVTDFLNTKLNNGNLNETATVQAKTLLTLFERLRDLNIAEVDYVQRTLQKDDKSAIPETADVLLTEIDFTLGIITLNTKQFKKETEQQTAAEHTLTNEKNPQNDKTNSASKQKIPDVLENMLIVTKDVRQSLEKKPHNQTPWCPCLSDYCFSITDAAILGTTACIKAIGSSRAVGWAGSAILDAASYWQILFMLGTQITRTIKAFGTQSCIEAGISSAVSGMYYVIYYLLLNWNLLTDGIQYAWEKSEYTTPIRDKRELDKHIFIATTILCLVIILLLWILHRRKTAMAADATDKRVLLQQKAEDLIRNKQKTE